MSNVFARTANHEWTNTTNNEWTYRDLSLSWLAFLTNYGAQCKIFYYVTLTGDGEDPVVSDALIPISSFQARIRYGEPTYLSVVIPNLDDYSTIVTDRSNGDMKIEMSYVLNGTEQYRETLLTVDLEDIATDEGAVNQSITLTGHRTVSYANIYQALTGVTYRGLQANGKKRFRCVPPQIYLKAGDLVSYDSDEIVIGNIAHTINVNSQTSEITEA